VFASVQRPVAISLRQESDASKINREVQEPRLRSGKAVIDSRPFAAPLI